MTVIEPRGRQRMRMTAATQRELDRGGDEERAQMVLAERLSWKDLHIDPNASSLLPSSLANMNRYSAGRRVPPRPSLSDYDLECSMRGYERTEDAK